MATKKTCVLLTAFAVAAFAVSAAAQDILTADVRAAIDKAATDVLQATGTPSASIAVVKDGKVAYTNAYGRASLEPAVNATAEMRYSIGSISKQFTAAAVLLLAEDGKLSLDDKVSRWLRRHRANLPPLLLPDTGGPTHGSQTN